MLVDLQISPQCMGSQRAPGSPPGEQTRLVLLWANYDPLNSKLWKKHRAPLVLLRVNSGSNCASLMGSHQSSWDDPHDNALKNADCSGTVGPILLVQVSGDRYGSLLPPSSRLSPLLFIPWPPRRFPLLTANYGKSRSFSAENRRFRRKSAFSPKIGVFRHPRVSPFLWNYSSHRCV